MKRILQLEEAGMFGLSIFIFAQTHFSWWLYLLLILTPDIGMLGYLGGNKTGAFFYNLFHHKGLAIIVLVSGWMLQNEYLELAGIILFGHASMDRLFGYGLKYNHGFASTHLGLIGKGNQEKEPN